MKFGFIAHPTSVPLLHQVKVIDLAGRMLREQEEGYASTHWTRHNLVPFAEFTRITSACGAECEGMIQFMPLTAEQMIAQPRKIAERVLEGVNALHQDGAALVGLGGFTGIVGNRGLQILERAAVPVTTGNSLTAYAAYQNLLECMARLNVSPEQAQVVVAGYPGSIAQAVARLLLDKGCTLHLVHRGTANNLPDDLPLQRADQVLYHAGSDECYDMARLFVTATSSGGVIDPGRLLPGSVVIDTALPRDVLPGADRRDDILVIEGGLVSATSDVSFGAMAFGLDPKRNLNGCMAETIILALEGRAEPFSIGRELPVDRVLEIGALAAHHGFLPTPMVSNSEAVSDSRFDGLRQYHLAAQAVETNDSLTPVDLRKKVLEDFGRHINPMLREFYQFNHVERVFVKGEGCWLTDLDGKRYLDFVAGYGCMNTGHNHPRISEALTTYLQQQYPTFVQYISAPLQASQLARRLAELAPGDMQHVFFSNSGTEAMEAAMKLALAASDRKVILYCGNGYHGKTLGALSITGRSKHRKPFEPLLPRCEQLPFGDIPALQARLAQGDVAAFIMEPIQGEGGVIVPPDGYLAQVRELCTQYECLWVLDEIQTGLGRTGKRFACDWEGVAPDIMALSKSLSGGAVPIGATLSTREVWRRAYGTMDTFALHTSTFGGGNFAAACAMAALDVLEEEKLADNAAQVGPYLQRRLQQLADQYGFIREVRGRGMMIAIEFCCDMAGGTEALVREMASRMPAQPFMTYRMMSDALHYHLQKAMKELESSLEDLFVLRFMTRLSQEHGVLTFVTANNNRVMRIQPPLTLTIEEADFFADAFTSVCADMATFE